MSMLRLTLAALAALLAAGPVALAADLLPPDQPIPTAVDHYINGKLKEENVKPAVQADDVNLLRRLTLDLVGRIPTASETNAYLSDKSADKRTRLVERLMASPAYARHLATELDTMLMSSAPSRASVRDFLLGAVKENRPWDQVYRQLMLPDESNPKQRGATPFLKVRARDLDRLTNDVSVVFFGVNVSCAQCHDHPLVTDWKQDHFFGMKAFFSGTYEAGAFLAERPPTRVQFSTSKGVTKQARMMFLTGKTVDVPVAAPLDKKKERDLKLKAKNVKGQPPPPAVSGRAKFVEVSLLPGERDFFARSFVNRTWHRLFGLGIVSPIDQMHSANAPSHPELLDWLARDFVAHNYDIKRLVRGLALTEAYARSSRWEGERAPRPNLFAVGRLRALTPMQLATSLRIATMSPESLTPGPTLRADELERRFEAQESAARGFASLIEQPRDDFQIGVGEALLFSNSERVTSELLGEGADRLVGKLKAARDIEKVVDLAVRNVLSRAPSAEEARALGDYLRARTDRPVDAYRQMVWALLTNSEFRFNY